MYSISVLKVFLQLSDGKLDETEGYKCLFIVNFVPNTSAQASELLNNIYTCKCLPFNELLLSICLHQPIKTFAHVTNVV